MKNENLKNKIDFGTEILKSIGILLVFLFSPTLISMVFSFISGSNNIVLKTIYIIVCNLVYSLIFFLIFRKQLKAELEDFKINRKDYLNKIIKYWIYGLLIMVACNFVLNFLINPDGLAVNEELNRNALGTTPVSSILSILLFAPFTEELTFRANFKKLFKNKILFALFTGLLFGFGHIIAGLTGDISSTRELIIQILYILPYGALGFAFGYIYFETNNIWSSIVAHFFHNALSLGLILVYFLFNLITGLL